MILAKYRKYLEFTALLLLAVGIVWWFGRKLDWKQVKAAVTQSDWRLIALAAIVIGIAYFWRAVRWQALLAPLTPAKLSQIWIATTVGFGAVLLIGRAGEVVRPVVLLARISAVLRRAEPARAEGFHAPLQTGPLLLWPGKRQAEWAGVRLRMTATEFSVLEVLARQAGSIVCHDHG